MSAIFGFTFQIGRMTEVLTPDIYRAHCGQIGRYLRDKIFPKKKSQIIFRVEFFSSFHSRLNNRRLKSGLESKSGIESYNTDGFITKYEWAVYKKYIQEVIYKSHAYLFWPPFKNDLICLFVSA